MLPHPLAANGDSIQVATVNHQLTSTIGPYMGVISLESFSHRFKRRPANRWRKRCGASFKSRKRNLKMRKRKVMKMMKTKMQRMLAQVCKRRAVLKHLAAWHLQSHLNMEGT